MQIAVPALPAIGGAAELASSLFTLALWGVALGLAIAWRYTIGAALEWAANLMDRVSFTVLHVRVAPLAPFSAELRAIDVAITKGLDKILVGAEHATVWLFHHGLSLIVWSARETWALARDTYRALEHFDKVWLPRAIHDALKATGAFATYVAHEIAKADRRLWRDATTLVHRLSTRTRTEVRVVRQSIAHALPRIGHVERDLTKLRARLRSIEKKITVGGLAALLPLVLVRLGLKWLRCSNVQKTGERLCGMNSSLLESLLADALLVGGAVSLVALAEEMQTVVGDSAGLIQRFWDAA